MQIRILAAASLLAFSLSVRAAPSGCDDLSSVPITPNVDYETVIRPLISEDRCGDACHAGGESAPGGLDLTESQIPLLIALSPYYDSFNPSPRDYLFHKINCDDPGDGSPRMPFGTGDLPIAEQALIYDWLEQGARGNVEGVPTDIVFRDQLESRRLR